ncbi:hypothetical protein [Sodalis sp.]|uniref:hypothetical protein n=1 Tax=Sodalis sp. (in: enterobacteria) TaxID=1898979 RepID=UPI003872B22D
MFIVIFSALKPANIGSASSELNPDRSAGEGASLIASRALAKGTIDTKDYGEDGDKTPHGWRHAPDRRYEVLGEGGGHNNGHG